MRLRSIEELKNLRGKRVLVRVDFNVPLNRGAIVDDTKIRAAVPTLKWLKDKGAKVVVMTHLGRPEKSKNKKVKNQNGLGDVTERLSELLKTKMQTVEEWDFSRIGKMVKAMKSGQLCVLPNLRLHPGEEKNDEGFAKELGALADFYVNEAFSVCHRKHASVAAIAHTRPSYAGFTLLKEVEVLGKLLHEPKRPFVVLMGGAKISDKVKMIKMMSERATAVLVGTALANNFFKAQGYKIGNSLSDPEGVKVAKTLLKNKKIVLPRDVVVGTKDGETAKVIDVANGSKILCEKPNVILDVGPKTILAFSHYIKAAQTLLWNGPVGAYEIKRFSHGTLALGRLFASRSKGKAFGVVGGGETIDAVKKTGMADYVDFISTGGGAMLEYLGGEELPGLQALYV